MPQTPDHAHVNLRNLSVASYANGQTLYLYRTNDSWETITSLDYWTLAVEMVKEHDFILISGPGFSAYRAFGLEGYKLFLKPTI